MCVASTSDRAINRRISISLRADRNSQVSVAVVPARGTPATLTTPNRRYPHSLNQPDDPRPADQVRVPVDVERATAVDLHVVADVLRPEHVLAGVTRHVQRSVLR